MSEIVVVGGGIVGLGASVLLARDGHTVTVVERDPEMAPAPEKAWDTWERRGVNQFRMLHFLQPRYRQELERAAPDVLEELLSAGAKIVNPLRDAPSRITGGFKPGDERFDAVTTRRPVAEAILARVADHTEGVEVRRGLAVAGLLTGDARLRGVPNVVGVRTEDGDELRADLVVDAAGRRSSLPRWIAESGGRRPEEDRADCGFVYYGRHFRSADGQSPKALGGPLQEYGTLSVLLLPADNGTWGVGLITSAKDREMRALRHTHTWAQVIGAFPRCAHWIDADPLDDEVAVMAKIEDRHRMFVVDGMPVATGVVAIADSWACTNPSVGRGISMGMAHATALRDLLHDLPADPVELQLRWHDATMSTVEPWYRATLAYDEARLSEIEAELEGRELEAPPELEATRSLEAAASKDPELLRFWLEIVNVLSLPEDVMARPRARERAMQLGTGWRGERAPGPDRGELVAILAGKRR